MLPNLSPDGYLRTDQKHPQDRAHLWDYANPHLTDVPAPVDRAFPRHVHKPQGEWLEVRNEAELEAALRSGYALQPPVDPEL